MRMYTLADKPISQVLLNIFIDISYFLSFSLKLNFESSILINLVIPTRFLQRSNIFLYFLDQKGRSIPFPIMWYFRTSFLGLFTSALGSTWVPTWWTLSSRYLTMTGMVSSAIRSSSPWWRTGYTGASSPTAGRRAGWGSSSASGGKWRSQHEINNLFGLSNAGYCYIYFCVLESPSQVKSI